MFLKLLSHSLLVLVLIAGCAAPLPPVPAPAVVSPQNFRLFLQPLPQEAAALDFRISTIRALRATGEEVLLQPWQQNFAGRQQNRRQQLLVAAQLPAGAYRGLRVRFDSASRHTEEGPMDLLPPAAALTLNHAFRIDEENIATLLLQLSGERLVTDGAFFTPQLSLWRPSPLLTQLKGFVSNRGSGDLTIFNKRTSQVVSSVRVGQAPSDLALDQQRDLLYVALAGENAVAVVDVNSERLLGRVALRFGDRPEELALSRDGATLLSLNQGSDTVSLIDTAALFETSRVRLPEEGDGLFFGAEDSRAYVAHSASNSLTVIDLPRAALRNRIALRESPLDGVAADGGKLYLINRYSGNLTALTPPAAADESRIFLGSVGRTIYPDRNTGLLYCGLDNGAVAVVDPRAGMAIDRYRLNAGPVRDLTIERDQNSLFVLVPEQARLYKLDLISKQILGRTIINAGGSSVAVMGER